MSNWGIIGFNILLIDEDEDDYCLIKDLLSDIEDINFTLHWVSEEVTALEELGTNNYDVCLCDDKLAKANGISLIHNAITRGCKIPIILLTGQEEKHTYLEAIQVGAVDYLVKGEITNSLLKRSLNHIIGRNEAIKALQESEERYALAVDGANDGLWDWNLKTNELYCSERWHHILGLTDDLINNYDDWVNRIHPEDQKRFYTELDSHFQGATSHFQCQYRIAHQDGTFHWVLTRGLAVRDQHNNTYRMAGSLTDLSSNKTHFDQLTNLVNRTFLLEQIDVILNRSKHQPSYLSAVIFCGCDRFKIINDSLGHVVGDQLLIAIARKLESCIRNGDLLAKLSGDQFAILLENLADKSTALKIAHRIEKELTQPFIILNHTIYISASFGIAYNFDNLNSEELLQNAHTAMHRAKTLGKARYVIFDRTMSEQAKARLSLETDLRIAIEKNQFQLHYQPIIALENNKIAGFEALVRWYHPTKGLISPVKFIPIAEETELIIPLSNWILEEACRQMYSWQQEYALDKSLTMSVNLSRKQLSQDKLVNTIDSIIQATKISPYNLKLEVTETALMNSNEDSATKLLLQLKELGLLLSLDDFGTGYSSLSCLHQFPIDILKIDRSFINRIGTEKKYLDIVRAIINIGHSLNLEIIAEGVETAAQLAELKQLQCYAAQGYFFYKPLDAKSIQQLIIDNLD